MCDTITPAVSVSGYSGTTRIPWSPRNFRVLIPVIMTRTKKLSTLSRGNYLPGGGTITTPALLVRNFHLLLFVAVISIYWFLPSSISAYPVNLYSRFPSTPYCRCYVLLSLFSQSIIRSCWPKKTDVSFENPRRICRDIPICRICSTRFEPTQTVRRSAFINKRPQRHRAHCLRRSKALLIIADVRKTSHDNIIVSDKAARISARPCSSCAPIRQIFRGRRCMNYRAVAITVHH